MKYVCSKATGKCYEISDDKLEEILESHPEDEEVSKDEAYLKLFHRISKSMEYKFSNYKQLDIMQECFYMLLKRYRIKGLFAPDKSFLDNEKIWWSFAKKSCLYIIRQYTDIISDIDVWSIEDNETDTSLCLGVCDNYELGESNSTCEEIKNCINKLCYSHNYADQQLGLYATCKLKGLDDQQACTILGIKMPRLYEIKRKLKEYFRLRFDNLI